jgi:hypothetical protein
MTGDPLTINLPLFLKVRDFMVLGGKTHNQPFHRVFWGGRDFFGV